MLLLGATVLGAQVDPRGDWRTLRTPHFRIHFTPETEALARRSAENGEAAWARLAAELRAPRGPVDVVIADNVDFTNGFATTFPTNRIVLYAHPPVDARSLRYYHDWNALVLTHELTHIFHLDRTRGWWRVAQRVFGRNPLLFPNQYSPSWLVEGLAVYYESRLTGYGRLAGSAHRSLARAAAAGGHVPALHELSLATSRWPGGERAYAYGSLLVEHLSRTRGDTGVRRLVERTAAQAVPFFPGRAARASFGVDFERAWREFSDSLARDAAAAPRDPLPAWRELTREGREAEYPRWLADGRLVYAAATGREVPHAYELRVPADGAPAARRRLGRRNGVDVTSPLPAHLGGAVFAQVEWTDPYTVRSDLWIEHGGRQRRLTSGARLSTPDARRGDGAIVAMQALTGTTRLVRVALDDGRVTPLTRATPDSMWAEPRWSPDGTRIAAVRWTRGGLADIVVLDTLGGVVSVAVSGRAVESAPSWAPDGRQLYFASDRSGVNQLWVVDVPAPGVRAGAPRRLSAAYAGIFQPEPDPAGGRLAAVLLRADGLHVGVAPLPGFGAAERGAAPPAPALPAARPSDAPSRPFSPWRSLLPRYWQPTLAETDLGEARIGATSSASDVVGRHAWAAAAALDLRRHEPTLGMAYRWAGLGRPLVDLAVAQDWSHRVVLVDTLGTRATLTRRERFTRVSATFERPRARSFSYVSVGAERERVARSVTPAAQRARFAAHSTDDALAANAAWSNARVPQLAISREDGVSLAASLRERRSRFDGGEAARSRLAIGVARAYRSLDLPGFSHHVLAARLAGGWETDSLHDLGAGGTSGGSLEVLPGYSIGSAPQTFGVRGFPPSSQFGTRALAGSVEYRAPLWMPSRGVRLVPAFLDRTSMALFADAGSAWCPAPASGATALAVCRASATRPRWMASVGAELLADVALQYDVPYRFRFGVALPVTSREQTFVRAPAVTGYATVGAGF